jgi:hypothetical protein
MSGAQTIVISSERSRQLFRALFCKSLLIFLSVSVSVSVSVSDAVDVITRADTIAEFLSLVNGKYPFLNQNSSTSLIPTRA